MIGSQTHDSCLWTYTHNAETSSERLRYRRAFASPDPAQNWSRQPYSQTQQSLRHIRPKTTSQKSADCVKLSRNIEPQNAPGAKPDLVVARRFPSTAVAIVLCQRSDLSRPCNHKQSVKEDQWITRNGRWLVHNLPQWRRHQAGRARRRRKRTLGRHDPSWSRTSAQTHRRIRSTGASLSCDCLCTCPAAPRPGPSFGDSLSECGRSSAGW